MLKKSNKRFKFSKVEQKKLLEDLNKIAGDSFDKDHNSTVVKTQMHKEDKLLTSLLKELSYDGLMEMSEVLSDSLCGVRVNINNYSPHTKKFIYMLPESIDAQMNLLRKINSHIIQINQEEHPVTIAIKKEYKSLIQE